jgi:multidrug efflux system membrane fusion protein
VVTANASVKNVPVEVQVIGNVEAYSTISVKAQVTGQLTSVHFQEGDYVKKNALLFEIDPRPLEAALNQTQAQLSKDEALMKQAEANLARDAASARYQESQANRYTELQKSGIISKDQAEQIRANADAVQQAVAADKAAIESSKASIGASRAAVDNAKVQLSYTKIYSPIDGRTGNLTVKMGNVVMANSMELVTINEVEPIYVTFSVPEAQLPAIKRYMGSSKLPVRAQPQDDSAEPETGLLTFVDNTVDTTTGTIKLKGTFTNHDHKLWPGEFVRVTLRLTTQQNAVVVPNAAVQTGQNGSFIYVVKSDKTVDARTITTGARVNEDIVVTSGLETGETVVTEGQLRLAPGSRITLRDTSGGRQGGGRDGGRRGGGGGRRGGAEGQQGAEK